MCCVHFNIIQLFEPKNKRNQVVNELVGLSNYNIPMPLASSFLISYVFKSNRIMCERYFLFLLFYNDNNNNIKLYHFPHLILFPLDLYCFVKKVNLITVVHKGREFKVCIVIVIVIFLYLFSYWLL